MKKSIFIFILTIFNYYSYSQLKEYNINKTTSRISIDGILDEDDWDNAEFGENFIEDYPNNGEKELIGFETKFKAMYDEQNLYIAIIANYKSKDNLIINLSKRDEINCDYTGVLINPLNDGQQAYAFFSSITEVQRDYMITINDFDDNWDAVWNSAVKINESNWVTEYKIPFSSIRFNSENTEWQLQIERSIKSSRSTYSWTFTDKSIGNIFEYFGKLKGLKNIPKQSRLVLIPNISFYNNTQKEKSPENNTKFGLDIKYGLSNNFTLDAILIPDFGQIKADEQYYNLTPFEKQFSEKREFYTESSNLFNLGDIFYSRRIGQAHNKQIFLDDYQDIIEPNAQSIINAIKISGRTKNGLGIGFLNSITQDNKAIIYNYDENDKVISKKDVQYNPLTNYNVISLDQRLKNNSSISIINTNFLQSGNDEDANVTAVNTELYTKSQKFVFISKAIYNYITKENNNEGYNWNINFNKIYGQHQFGISFEDISKYFNINHMGISFYRNLYYSKIWYNYNLYNMKDSKLLNSFSFWANHKYTINKDTKLIETFNSTFGTSFNNKKNNYYNIYLDISPINTFNFYETRNINRYSKNIRNISLGFLQSPNYNKKFLIDKYLYISFGENNYREYTASLSFRYTPISNLYTYITFDNSFNQNTLAYHQTINDDIYYTKRNYNEFSFSPEIEYYFNKNMYSSISARYYWNNINNKDLLYLKDNGDYNRISNEVEDNTYNYWNFDFRLNYIFILGSELTIMYRNSLENFEFVKYKNINENLSNFSQLYSQHTFSIRIKYYFDTNKVKYLFNRKNQ